MAYPEIGDVNTSAGIHTLFVHVNDVTSGLFTRGLLLMLFLIIGVGSYLSQQRASGRGDLPASFAIAGFIAATAAVIMTFIPGMILVSDVIIIIGISILCVLWLYLSKRN